MARPTLHLIPLAVLVAGCAPQSAILTEGSYWAFLSTGTSFSLGSDLLDPEDFPQSDTWNVDCLRYGSRAEREARQLDPRLDVCRPEEPDPQPLCKMASTANRRPQPGVDTECEQWLDQSAWRVLHEKLDPWRGEAIITGENDFQVSFHHRLPGGEDFRFSFLVALDFQPTQCEIDESGELVATPIHGDWVAEWTKDLRALGELDELPASMEILRDYIDDPDAKLYYLNARGYQFNPRLRADNTFWSIPYEWRAGFGAGKYSAELFHTRAPRWGQVELYDEFDLEGEPPENNPDADIWYCNMEPGADPAENSCMQARVAHANAVADQVAQDLALVGLSTEGVDASTMRGAGEPIYRPLVHDNMWRTPDGQPAGLDGWVELHYNYVVISGDVTPGEPVEGAFSLVMDGDESNSRWVIQGKFEVPRVRNDRWTAPDLRELKHEEHGTKRCSGLTYGFDD